MQPFVELMHRSVKAFMGLIASFFYEGVFMQRQSLLVYKFYTSVSLSC
jgi:hypothetical protein